MEEKGSSLRASKDKHEKEADKSTARSVLDGLVTGPGEKNGNPVTEVSRSNTGISATTMTRVSKGMRSCICESLRRELSHIEQASCPESLLFVSCGWHLSRI